MEVITVRTTILQTVRVLIHLVQNRKIQVARLFRSVKVLIQSVSYLLFFFYPFALSLLRNFLWDGRKVRPQYNESYFQYISAFILQVVVTNIMPPYSAALKGAHRYLKASTQYDISSLFFF